jgi:hypothetical protein
VKQHTSKVIVEKGKAGYSGIYILSSETTRTIADILTAGQELKRRIFVWNMWKGLWEEFAGDKLPALPVLEGTPVPADQHNMPGAVLDLIPKLLRKYTAEELSEMTPAQKLQAKTTEDTKSIFVLNHFHHFLDDPGVQAKLIDMVQNFKTQQKILVILSPILKLPVELEKEFALIETELPDKDDLRPILESVVEGVKGASGHEPSEERKEKLLEAALGLTTPEAENAFALSYVRPKQEKRDDVWDPAVVMEEKCATLRKTGLLQFYPPGHKGMSAIGGMNGIKDWVSRRKRAFTKEAADFGLPAPKGILMVGVPGTGKSLGAKALAEELGLPLLRCDMGRIYAGLVGASEANVRSVIRIAEAVAPCVLWFDEIEKGIAGSDSGHDSGVGARVLGSLLTWMQEKTAPVFVYATANKITALPPEFLRKGRFDEIFGVDLPDEDERLEIWKVQLRNFKRENLIASEKNTAAKMLDLPHFVKDTAGYSGAEIEAAIKEALFAAFDSNTELNSIDLQDAIDNMIPLSQTMAADVEAIRDFVKKRARPANQAKLPKSAELAAARGQRVLEA